MKKIAFTMASMLIATGAMAAGETALTTKKYVNDGLSFVYQKVTAADQKAEAAKTAAAAAQTAANNAASQASTNAQNINTINNVLNGTTGENPTNGLIKDVEDLQSALDGKASSSDLTTLSDKVNNATTGLDSKASQAALNALQQTVNGLDGNAYTGENGVKVENHKVSLDVPAAAANDGNAYVYKNGAWSALEVENTWSSDFLTGQPGNNN